jgi:hypothetical protein
MESRSFDLGRRDSRHGTVGTVEVSMKLCEGLRKQSNNNSRVAIWSRFCVVLSFRSRFSV